MSVKKDCGIKKLVQKCNIYKQKPTTEAQQKSVEQLKSQIEKTTIKAPFDGVIDACN